MPPSYINNLSDDLLAKIIWYSPKHVSARRQSENWSDAIDSILSRPRYTSENPYGDDPKTSEGSSGLSSLQQNGNNTTSPLSAPNILTDPAYNLLIASPTPPSFYPNLESGEASNPFSFTQMPSLTALEFETWCPRFELLFPSGNSFTRLELLLIKGCDSLERLPDYIGEQLPRLREPSLCGCEKLLELPETFGNIHTLKTLTLNLLPLSSLPGSFTQLTSLESLYLSHCNEILELPARFGCLNALNSLSILDSDLRLPDDIGSLTNLLTFRLSKILSQLLLPSSFTQLSSLTSLHITKCRILAELSEDVGKLSNLRVLTVQSCPNLQNISESLTFLVNLEVLKVVDCDSLTAIPSSLSNLRRLKNLALAKLPNLEQVSGSLPCSLELLSLGSFERLTSLLETPALPKLREFSSTSERLMGGLAAGLTLPSLEHLQLEFVGNT
ncbi:unnamed protein product [Closterium sp. NIES-54]